MEKSNNRHMLLLILRTPMVFESITEILSELNVDSIVLKGSQVTNAEEGQNLELPMVGGFLRFLEKDAPESKAILTVMDGEVMEIFEARCEAVYGNLVENKDFSAFVLPVLRTLGQRFEFAG